MLNYNHLYYFHVAALEGSVASAAQRLGVTQPTVSEQVRALERALGVSLFERHPTGLKLTEAGRLTFEHTSVMFRASERLAEALGRSKSTMPRSLRIGISSPVARTTTTDFLMPVLALDNCVPCIRAADSAELMRDLRGSDLDLVLCESEPPEAARRGIEVVEIDKIKMVAIAPPSAQLAPDWQDARMIQYSASSSFRWEVEAFLEQNGLRPQIAAEADDGDFLVEAAARGGHVVVVPRSCARDAIKTGRVRVVADLTDANAGVYAAYADGVSAELARRAVQVLVDHVRSHHVD